jgi:hypothetical protein
MNEGFVMLGILAFISVASMCCLRYLDRGDLKFWRLFR